MNYPPFLCLFNSSKSCGSNWIRNSRSKLLRINWKFSHIWSQCSLSLTLWCLMLSVMYPLGKLELYNRCIPLKPREAIFDINNYIWNPLKLYCNEKIKKNFEGMSFVFEWNSNISVLVWRTLFFVLIIIKSSVHNMISDRRGSTSLKKQLAARWVLGQNVSNWWG